jgi:hypothetical protein
MKANTRKVQETLDDRSTSLVSKTDVGSRQKGVVMSSEFDLEAWSHERDQNRSIFLNDGTPGDIPVEMSIGDLEGALAVAARWRGGCSATITPQLLTCLQNGLIGVSRPMAELAGELSLWADQSDHLVVTGGEGANFKGVAHCLLQLATDRQNQGILQPWPDAQFGVYECGTTLFVYDIETLCHSDQGAILNEIEKGARVIGFTHRPLEVMDEALAPSLARYFRLAGTVDMPPLCVRPDDIPLLAFYYISQYSRTEHGVHGITVSSLYMASGERWSTNEMELRSWIKRACEDPCDIWAHLLDSEEAEGPFVPGGAAFQAAADLPGTPIHTDFHPINVEKDPTDSEDDLIHTGQVLPEVDGLLGVSTADLPAFDLRSLLEAVDTAAEPGQRGRWTLDHRMEHLQEETWGDRRKTISEASADDPATHVAGSDEENKCVADNIFRRTDSGWEFCYAGGAFFGLDDDNGSRSMAYLLNAWMQPRHPDVRYPEGGAAEVLAWATKQEIDQRTRRGADLQPAIAEYRKRLDEIGERRSEIESELSDAFTPTDQQLEELANEDERLDQEVEKIQKELSSLTDRRGQPRRPRPPGVEAVESALRRFKKSIEKRCPGFHEHLNKALKMGTTPRYSPDEDVQWEVQL